MLPQRYGMVLLVVSDMYEVNSPTGVNMYVLYFDPGTKAFLKKVPLPAPATGSEWWRQCGRLLWDA